ncbi:MAG: N-acetylmuramoyl-L-alanine amidase [Planctomycetes bacterium]|nr:N-acetylmuramoyl-L-alanine amidase [Planctomycetota bacterium]
MLRRCAGALAALLVVGCSAVPPTPLERGDALPPPPTYAAVTAPARGESHRELDALRRFPDHPGALLRSAWLLQETGQNAASLRPLNLIVHGLADEQLAARGRDVQPLARWLRARAQARLGHPDQAADDLALARQAAVDPGLIAALAAGTGTADAPLAEADWRGVPVRPIPREAWRAAPARGSGMEPMGAIERITIHHSGTVFRAGSRAASIAAIRAIQRDHQDERHWADIAYHYLIDPDGRVWTGRDLRWQGAHAGDPERNRHNVGICLLGNFVPNGQGRPPAVQLAALRGLVVSLAARHDIAPDQILTHRELKTTECPGPFIQSEIAALRRSLAGAPQLAGPP